MAISKAKKQDTVKKLVEAFNASKSVVISDYQGLKVSEIYELRTKLREQKAEMIVAKNTLVARALQESNLKEAKLGDLTGPVAVTVSKEDETAGARVLFNFAKDHKQVTLKQGLLGSEVIDTAKVEYLATLPTKQELLAKVVGTIKAPVSGFVNVLAGNLRGLVQVLNQIKESKS